MEQETHIYYSPKIDEFRFITGIDICQYCPHEKVTFYYWNKSGRLKETVCYFIGVL